MNRTVTPKKVKQSKTNMNASTDNTNEFPYEPGINVIKNILNYSKALSIKKSKSNKVFEMVLN